MTQFSDIKQVVNYLAEYHFISTATRTLQLNLLNMGGPLLHDVRGCYTVDNVNDCYVIKPEFEIKTVQS